MDELDVERFVPSSSTDKFFKKINLPLKLIGYAGKGLYQTFRQISDKLKQSNDDY